MSDRNQMVTETYFDQLSDEYVKLIVESQRQIYRNINPVLTRRVKGRVLTLGCGPVMNFADTNTEHVVCLDIAMNMLRQLPAREKISRVKADAQFLPFDAGTFDTVVIPFLIHHIAMESVIATDRAVSRTLGEASRVLRRDGRIIIADLFIPSFIEMFERTFYGFATSMLNRKMKPMMHFYSLSTFKSVMENIRLALAFDTPVEMDEKIMPTLLIPSFKISPKYHPARFHILEVTKII